jgi:hypothetical protein
MTNHLKLKAWGVVLAAFTFGAITGAAVDGLYRIRAGAHSGIQAEAARRPIVETLRRELNLSDEQILEIRRIAEESRGELRESVLEKCPEFATARQHMVARVRSLLRSEQRERFDAFIARGGFQTPP